MPPKVKFNEGERVLCFHGPLLYEAKCVKTEMKDKTVRYFIHYNGWNKSWDEWVPESRVLKYNEAGLQKQRELIKAHESGSGGGGLPGGRNRFKAAKITKGKKSTEKEKDKEKVKEKAEKEREKEKPLKDKEETRASTPVADVSSSNTPSTTSKRKLGTLSTPVSTASSVASIAVSDSGDPTKKKRVRMDNTVESEEHFLTKIEIKIRIPDDLKPWLVDDWDLITRQKQLVSLPCKLTVNGILDEYVRAKLVKPNNPHKDAILEMTQGIREYFNVMLGTQLLYKFERPQYAEILADHPDLTMSQIYGATHLLRLFVKLGGMLAYTQLDERSVQLLLTHIHDFLKFMAKHTSTFFTTGDYMVAPPEYHRKAL